MIAVLGNHDWQSDRTGDVARTLGAAVRAIDVQLDLPPGFALASAPATDKLNDIQTGAPRLAPNASLVLHRGLRHCAAKAPRANDGHR